MNQSIHRCFRNFIDSARGFCKNRASCRFVHSDGGADLVGSPSRIELLRSNLIPPRLSHHFMTRSADGRFREEDVSNYFSTFGTVQDVRIPYQQKRMFGFVTFVYPETVKSILAKGNPHFVCDSRVLVKPYKEKGKVSEKCRTNQTTERELF
ncbi:PREDICTED: zinc finger CCCH domain-containing protein 46-like [Camelina sativa]|uniref:Zinc finger CCCH domain-containing protein 46-like n=1 Tax=Camelina sativa TaxID=90675 RepID=A0ABM1QHK1_CAMSA|nr:PREDICTED: zinc finger CCCH domain-containing protein 46-like [Camelina sativa]